ncbi:MAG: gliding motility-associated C-terminal domain-containing protein [Bacteroidota bacterium]|nr:gliding motility-associated C-terminal domain-containing protein [Bacteroidota bacterium]
MTGCGRIIAAASLVLLSALDSIAQPVWVTGTPAVPSTGPLSININYGIDRVGTVYAIVYNYNNTTILTSAQVRTSALLGPTGTITATLVRSIAKADIGRVIQSVLNVINPNQIHTIYIVAADSKAKLQASPVRLNATTLSCPQANAGTGGDECDLNFVLNAVPVLGTGTWTKVSGPGNATFSPNANTANATVTVTAYGSYTFRWTEVKGVCKSSADIIVNFIQPPVANAGTGGDVCDLDFVLQAVTGSSDDSGTWSMTSGTGTATFSPDAHSPVATVTVSESGTKVFTWTVIRGVCSSSSSVTVNFNQQPSANAGTGGNNCGLEFYLSAVPSVGTGTWTKVSGPGTATFSPNTHTPNAKVTVTRYGTYVFRWTEVNGTCASSASVTVGFFQQISADAGNGGDECDLNFQLNAVPASGTCTWAKVGGPGTATFSPNEHQYNAVVTVSEPGIYDFSWTVITANCSSVDIIRVGFHAPPSVDAGTDIAICKGSSTNLHAEGAGTFLWSPAGPLNNPNIQDPVATPTITTVFTVTLTDQWNCRNSDNVTIEVREKPVANAGPDQILNYLFETDLQASTPKSQEVGEWKVVNGTGVFDDMYNNKTRVSKLSLGDNDLVWTVSNAVCAESSDTVMIRVNNLIIPTLITPNNDGKNDFFTISGLESFGKSNLTVFNRWGAVVYSTENYNNNWDGKDNKGNLLSEDTYFFIIQSEKSTPIKGYLVIKH